MRRTLKILSVVILFGCSQDNVREGAINRGVIGIKPYELGLENCYKIKNDSITNSPFLMKDCMIGCELPTFEVTSLDGKIITNETLKGKISLINFWFTSCPPCIAEVPGFNAIYKKYGPDKINFITIARNTEQEIQNFLVNHPWSFSHISNERNIIENIFKTTSYPTTYLLNKDAQIIRSFEGGVVGEQAVNELHKLLIAPIEEALRTSPQAQREEYPNYIGDIAFDPSIDNKSFRVCNTENIIYQYFNNGYGLEYEGERAAIIEVFEETFKPIENVDDSGLLGIRFVVNCEGKTDRFRLSGMNKEYKKINFHPEIADQIITITTSLNGWKTKKLNGSAIDYYQILNFKFENGLITEILP